MKNLKDLTPEECVAIAKIINPNVDWKFTISKHKWNGFDIVDDEESPLEIVQIDYTEKSCFENKIKYFINLKLRHIPFEVLSEIHTFLINLSEVKQNEDEGELEILNTGYFEKLTNKGDLCKFFLKIARKSKVKDSISLLLTKKVITENKTLYTSDGSWKLLKESEDGKYVFQQNFSIKLSTLEEINNWIKETNID